MSVRLHPIAKSNRGPIHLVIAGYRSRPDAALIEAARLPGATYAVHWAAGKWAEAGASVGVMARGVRVGVPAMRTGKMLLGVGSIAGFAGGALVVGAGQFRHRYWCANRDGQRLAALLDQIPGARKRPLFLYGHSLGTVVARSALQTIAEGKYRIEDVVLMGGMASRHGWEAMGERFRGRLINLYSPRDRILSIAPVWDRVVGTGEVVLAEDSVLSTQRVVNHDLCERLPSQFNAIAHHSGYWKHFGGYVGRGLST
ncbi:DUF726 domain-containing protein [Rhodopirellula sallentina]|uniref:DUF726 domain-containing protein n=1 Tax=Rhodopirellula sallentina SM41 TaxID=1263870 RepID=M5TX83_9BACT|nr:DUF726 domain-containing protein [Rhodopirellula sallentina]EMI53785.1 hypothetical protein RSSM_04778 [Rhodopirellula sallentina SM41]